MREELPHALLIGDHLEIHIDLEVTLTEVSVRPLQQHPQVVYCAMVALADIDHNAGVLALLECDLAVLVFWFLDDYIHNETKRKVLIQSMH